MTAPTSRTNCGTALHHYQGLNYEVWGNRLLRAGIGVGGAIAGVLAGAQAGAFIGAAVGAPGGPAAVITAAVGALVGAGVGVAAKPLKGLADRAFLGKDGVLKKRRVDVAKQVGPILDGLTQAYLEVVTAQLDLIRSSLATERARSHERSKSLDQIAGRWTQHSETLRALMRDLDQGTTAALLRIAGRERLARSVVRATRMPGVGIVAEFEDSAFWEAWLYPPDVGERLSAGKAPIAGAEATSVLTYALGLVDADVSLVQASSTAATLRIDADIPHAIIESWCDALTAHIGQSIHIETTRRSSKS